MNIFICKKYIKRQGFTLIELMLVVAIIAILAAIAYPSYLSFVRKGWRAEGRAAITQALLEQERYMAQTGTYKTFTPGAPGPFSAYSGSAGVDNAAYSLEGQACSSNNDLRLCINVVATPTSGKQDSQITSMSMDSYGNRKCNGDSSSGICWE